MWVPEWLTRWLPGDRWSSPPLDAGGGSIGERQRHPGAASAARHDAFALLEFTCRRRNGSRAVVPQGPCVVEEGPHFAAICWQAGGHRGHAEVSLADLRQHIALGHIAYTAPWAKQA